MKKKPEIKNEQIEFQFPGKIQEKLFTHQNLARAKIYFLSSNLSHLTFGEVAWLSNIETFFTEKNYITEKQINVLHSIVESCEKRVNKKAC